MTKTLRDSEECLQRMEALLRRMAKRATVPNEIGVLGVRADQAEARAIIAELDGPSEETKLVRELLLHMHGWFASDSGPHFGKIVENIKAGVWDDSSPGMRIREAIAKGRELERAEQQNNGGANKANVYKAIDGGLAYE